MLEGYIKLHRKITEWEWYDDANTLRLFLHVLLNANHTSKNWHGIEIKSGELLTGRFKLAQALKLSEQQIRTSLNKLKLTNVITIKSTSQYSIITIKNWNLYQQNNQQNNQRITNEQPTNNQRITTTKNEENEKNEKNVFIKPTLEEVEDYCKKRKYGEFQNVFLTDEEYTKLKEIYADRLDKAINKLSSYIASKGKKYKSHYAVLGKHNWVYEEIFKQEQKPKIIWGY